MTLPLTHSTTQQQVEYCLLSLGILVPPALLFKSQGRSLLHILSTAFLDIITISPGCSSNQLCIRACTSDSYTTIIINSTTTIKGNFIYILRFFLYLHHHQRMIFFLINTTTTEHAPPNPLWSTCSCCSCGTPGVLPVS
jgi:hypothetical protein